MHIDMKKLTMIRTSSYIIQHDMGKKWSVYLISLYQFLFNELGQNKKID